MERIKVAFIFLQLIILVDYSVTAQSRYIDPRDNETYPLLEIDGLAWFGKNLNYQTTGSYCYDLLPSNCEKYGRLYEWEVALKACPEGWHLSTEYEWQHLETFLGMDERELSNQLNRGEGIGDRLKTGGDSGFNEQYGGWGGSDDGLFLAIDTIGTYWTAGEVNLDRAWHRDININKSTIYRSAVIKPYALSVRCVSDREYESKLPR